MKQQVIYQSTWFTEKSERSLPETRGQGEIVRKVKHSSVRIENPLSALYMGTEYFSLARTFRTVWGGEITLCITHRFSVV